jgi:DNA-directed RNA polymerase subunit N (RpoN/RPB10)
MIPVRCFTCNAVLGHMEDRYKRALRIWKTENPEKAEELALNELGLKKICCRRMIISHVPVHDIKMDYMEASKHLPADDTSDKVLKIYNQHNSANIDRPQMLNTSLGRVYGNNIY